MRICYINHAYVGNILLSQQYIVSLQSLFFSKEPLLLTWFNFNPSMDK